MLVKEFKGDLQPKYDSRKSFYGKAQVEQIRIQGGDKVVLLYSYNSIVSAIIETKDHYRYFYLNNLIEKERLTSPTTLRHIKEFYRQFYRNETRTQAELLKTAIIKNFDFLEVHDEMNNEITTDIAEYRNYFLTTSPETTEFFKNFKRYRQTQKQDSKGKYLYTSSVYGYSNYYFYYI